MFRKLFVPFGDDVSRAERLVDQLNVIKVSTQTVDFEKPMEQLLERDSTFKQSLSRRYSQRSYILVRYRVLSCCK